MDIEQTDFMDVEEETRSSFINPSSQIETQFQDVANSNSSLLRKGKQKKDDVGIQKGTRETVASENEHNQDWEWVEETEYIILDFGGANADAKDMEKMTCSGYSLIGLDTPSPYFKAGAHAYKGFWDENAITEDLVFEMKAREETEEGMDDSDDENNPDSLDLTAIVTKRVIFEPVELVPIPTPGEKPQEKANITTNLAVQADSQAIDNTTGKKDTKMSIWKAAYDAVGIQQTYRRRRKPKSAVAGKRKRSPIASVRKTDKNIQAEISAMSSSADQVTAIQVSGDDRDHGEYEDMGEERESE
ncbi:hypothetical protein BGX21_007871 [Mortierella sp. AD011]|nr:hypothetical protein BGX20_005167 [Mortierella sp. AD010]KAF9398373.1 hypothetical protein BGX21_007871 [Mortierella sp. AD011]